MNPPDDNQKDFFASESAQPGAGAPSTSDDEHDDEDGPGIHTGERPDEIDWFSGEEVVVQEQRAVAVYLNSQGGIVIRAERHWDAEEDSVIVLAAPGAAYRLIEAIQKQLEILKEHRKR